MFLALFSSVFVLPCIVAAQNDKAQQPLAIPATPDFEELRQMKTVQVDQVINALTIRLKDNRIIQLSGIEIPDLTPYDAGDIALKAQNEMEARLPNRKIRLYQTKDDDKGRINRLGYHLAHVMLPTIEEDEDGEKVEIWLQGFLVVNGLARVRPNERNPEMADQLYALEDKARKEKRGLWNAEKYPQFAVYDPSGEIPKNDFAIVEGTVKSVATVRNTTYLNFGDNWRDDFTIALDSGLRRDLSKAGTDALSLEGQKIRVRGWVEDYNGPFIRLEDMSLIQLLPEEADQTNVDG